MSIKVRNKNEIKSLIKKPHLKRIPNKDVKFKYVFTQHLNNGQHVTQGQFLIYVLLVPIQSFPSSSLVAQPSMKKYLVCLTVYAYMVVEKRGSHFHKGISVKWNTNCCNQELNFETSVTVALKAPSQSYNSWISLFPRFVSC